MTPKELKEQLIVKLAPIFVKANEELVERLAAQGVDPQTAQIDGKSIRQTYAEYCVEWANTIVEAYEKSDSK